MSKSDPFIQLDNLTIQYDKKIILNGISLSIEKGEKVAIVGPSGVGKTTLLKKIYSLNNDNISFIQQNYSLIPQLSIFHNIYMGKLDTLPVWYNLLNLIYPIRKEKEAILNILKKLDLEEALSKKSANLSGGQQQRLAIGRAFYRDSDLILADEPVAALDPENSKKVLSLLLSTNKTVISALHNTTYAKQYFNRIVGVKDKKIVFDLSTEEITDNHFASLYAS